MPEGESLTVQPIGTPDLLLVKNLDFEAPGFDTGRPTDFTTDLAVYQNGPEIARKTIRVNDPLVGRRLHVPPERVRAGAAPRDPRHGGRPAVGRAGPADRVGGRRAVRDDGRARAATSGCSCCSAATTVGEGVLVVLPYRVVGTNPDGADQVQDFDPVHLRRGDAGVRCARHLGRAAGLRRVHAADRQARSRAGRSSGLAFVFLIAGITITFYRPRRRIWARLDAGRSISGWSSVPTDTSTSSASSAPLLDDLVAVRRPPDRGQRRNIGRDDPPRSPSRALPDRATGRRRRAGARARRPRGRLGPGPQAARAGVRCTRDGRSRDHPGSRARGGRARRVPDRRARRRAGPSACPGRAARRGRHRGDGGGARRGGHDRGPDRPAAGPDMDPVALERSVIGFLVNRRAELDRRAADLEAQLAGFALLGRGLDVQAATIGAFLGRAVVIEGRRGDPIAVHAPADVPTAAAAVARYLARPAGSARCGSISRHRRRARCGRAARAARRRAAQRARADRRGADRGAARAGARPRRGRPPGPGGDSAGRPAAGRRAALGGDAREPGARPTGPDDIAAREETRAELRLLMSPRRLLLRGSSESLELRLVAAAPADDPGGLATGGPARDIPRSDRRRSRPFHEPSARPAAEAAARATLEAAERCPEPPRSSGPRAYRPTCCSATSGTCPTASARHGAARADPRRAARDPARAAGHARAVLASPEPRGGAARLGVHRNTIAYRVERLEARADWDLVGPRAAGRPGAGRKGHAKCTRGATYSGTEPQPDLLIPCPPEVHEPAFVRMHKRHGGFASDDHPRADPSDAHATTTVADVMSLARETGVKIVDLRFVDLPGQWQHFSIPVKELARTCSRRASASTARASAASRRSTRATCCYSRIRRPRIVDPTLKVPTLSMICDVVEPGSREPYTRDPRYIAHKAERYLTESGIATTSFWGPEIEFYIFNSLRFDQTGHSGYLLHRLRRGHLELAAGTATAEPRLPAAVQGGLLPGPADGQAAGPALARSS